MRIFEDHWGYLHILPDADPDAYLKCFQSFGGYYFYLPDEDEEYYIGRVDVKKLTEWLDEANKGDALAAEHLLQNLGNDIGDEMWMEKYDFNVW